jgi:hypothetical protein
MCAEASTVLRAVAADFFFKCWYLEIPSDNVIYMNVIKTTVLFVYFILYLKRHGHNSCRGADLELLQQNYCASALYPFVLLQVRHYISY